MMSFSSLRTLAKKKSVNNGLWLYALQFFNTIIPLLTIPYITRLLGATQYGVFSIALNYTSYLQVAVEYGFALSATRKVAFVKNEDELSLLFSAVITCRLILYLCSLVITAVFIIISNRSQEFYLCLSILAIALIGYCFQENWLYQGKQEMKFISISSIIARTATTICIFLFVKNPTDIVLYCVLYSLSPVITNLLGTIIGVYRYKIKWRWLSFKDIMGALKDGMYVFFTNLSSKVFGAIGITFLGLFKTDYDVGIYSALYKIPYLLMLLWSPISQVIYPIGSKRVTENYITGKKFIFRLRKYCLLTFGILALFVAALSRPISLVAFGNEYAEKYYIILPLLLWMLMGINNNFTGIQLLVGSGHDKEYSKAFQLGVVVTIISNAVLIYFFGIIGAAFAPLLSEIILGLLLWKQVKKVETST